MKKQAKGFISKLLLIFTALVTMATSFVSIAIPAQAVTGNILPPFDIGQTWYVCQGYNNPNVTHHDNGPYGTNPRSSYALDLTAGLGCGGSTSGMNVRTPLSGTVHYWSYNSGSLCVNTNDGRSVVLTHINASVTAGSVSAGQLVGTVAVANDKNNGGIPHIHLQLWDSPGCWGTGNGGIPFDTAHNSRICGAADFSSSGTGSNGAWSGEGIVGSSCTDPDGDGDTVNDGSDWCPLIVGLVINYGCPRPNSQRMTADFNKDGRADVAAFFDYGSGNSALFTWNGQADGKLSPPDKKWQATSGWEGVRLIPIGTGDFDGDTNQDIASFFNYGNGALGLFVWYGNGNGSFTSASSSWFAGSGWDGARIKPGGVGDFNQDGRADVTAFFNYGGSQTALFAWNGQTSRVFTVPSKRWEALSGWDARRLSTGVSGDFNGDGYQDVTAFFDYGGTSTGVFVWGGNGTGSLTLLPRSWFAASGWDSVRIIPAGASDFNQDGRSDVAVFFDYGGGNSALLTWNGRADGLLDAPDKKWQATSGWDAYRITPFGSADFNGDGKQDVSAFFDYGGSSTGAFLWSGNGSGSFSLLPRSWFAASGWDSARIIPNR